MTYGSIDVGRWAGSNTTRRLRLWPNVGFCRVDANGNDEELLPIIDLNATKISYSQAASTQVATNKTKSEANETAIANFVAAPPNTQTIYIQGSASGVGQIFMNATTRNVMFHTHPSAGNYSLYFPRLADTFDGMRITIMGGHVGTGSNSSTSKAFLAVHWSDYSINPAHFIYENSTYKAHNTQNYLTFPLQQTKLECVYHTTTAKWWCFGGDMSG